MAFEEQDDDLPRFAQLSITSLIFDLKNPRFKKLSNQQEALNSFCIGEYAKKTVRIAEHIAENGPNPSEMLMVTRVNGRRQFEVLEGNRRLAALKILSMPARINELPFSAPFKSRLRKAAATFDRRALERIPCVKMPTRQAANVWIALKHTGENEGAGVVGWDGEEARRFRGRDPAVQLLDYVRENAGLSQPVLEKLKKFPVSTLERLLADPDVRRALGLALTGGEIRITHPQAEVLVALGRVVEDLASKRVTVTALKKKGDRTEYINGLKGVLPKSPALATPISLDGSEVSDLPDQQGTVPTKASQRALKTVAPVRTTLARKSCVLPITLPKIEAVFTELKSLSPLDRFPNAAAALLRIFVDVSTNEYVKSHQLQPKVNSSGHAELKPRIQAVLDHLRATGVNPEACKAAQNALLQNSGLIFIDRLHLLIHGRYEQVTEDHLRKGWDQIEPFLTELWDSLSRLANESSRR